MTPRCHFGSIVCLRRQTPCRQCRAFVARLCREFQRDVFFGRYLPSGHTPAEWAATQRRRLWRAA